MSGQAHSIDAIDGNSPIVHISDIHGYLEDARSSLQAVGETDTFDPIVTADDDGTLHWADNDYVLVINGDLIDRGPANNACLDLAWRLQREASSQQVRYHLGNHEMAILLPVLVRWPSAFSTNLTQDERLSFLDRISDGEVTAAFQGHQYIYSHAGRNEAFSPADINESLRTAANELYAAEREEDQNSASVQRRLVDQYPRLFALGRNGGRGPDAGLCWMDFSHLEESAPPQIVGHSMRKRPVRKGNVVCGNIIRMNHDSRGGEGVLIETQNELTAVLRRPDGSVTTTAV